MAAYESKVDPHEYDGKRALVTGGTKGIGQAVVARLRGPALIAKKTKHVSGSRTTIHESQHLRHVRRNFPLYADPHFAIVIALLSFLHVRSARQRPRGTRHAEAFPHSQPTR
jgi:hypothetical protein